MRSLLYFYFIFLSNQIFSQVQFENSVDEFTGKKIIETKPWHGTSLSSDFAIDTGLSLFISMFHTNSQKENQIPIEGFYLNIFLSQDYKLGCLEKGSGKIILLFQNGDTISFIQFSKTDCEAISASYVFFSKEDAKKNSKEDIQKLMLRNLKKISVHKVAKVRVYGSSRYHDFIISDTSINKFSEHAKVILSNR